MRAWLVVCFILLPVAWSFVQSGSGDAAFVNVVTKTGTQ